MAMLGSIRTGERRLVELCQAYGLATIERFVYLGSTTQVFVALPGGDRVQALVANSGDVEEYDVGAAVTAHLPADALRILADDEAVTA